ncbi:MAG: hypothetical protein JWM99_1128 [Verrucomicrobiales bacterium]|nr:hypothetical protein [Verrucomicrobiales bacterium]
MKTILLVDDDHVFRTMLRDWFADNHWEVFEAEDGETGVQMAREHRPDVVICDLLMPRINGFQVCRALKAEPEIFANTKVIVTTGSGYETDRVNAFEAGADYYVTKPVKPDDVLKLLQQPAGARDPQKPTTQTERLRAARLAAGNRLKFWGVRGSVPTPGPGTVRYGGNTSCIEIRADGELIILDAGTGIRVLGLELVSEFKDRAITLTLLISHTHWDHIQGFPFFAPAYQLNNNIRVLAYDGAQAGLQAALASQMESPYFPITMSQMPSTIRFEQLKDLQFNIGKVKVEAAFMNHPGICVGYRLQTTGGSVAYIPDNELYERLKSEGGSADSKDPRAIHDFARQQDLNLLEFVRDADILIIDAQYDCTEYPRFVGWGHSCMDDTVRLAVNAGVKKLFLFHHDPGHDDRQIADMVAHGRDLVTKLGGATQVEAAQEGLEVEIKAPASVFSHHT